MRNGKSCWYDGILNVHAPAEDKTDDMRRDSFHEELEHVLNLRPIL
jgi:hypothetical protein